MEEKHKCSTARWNYYFFFMLYFVNEKSLQCPSEHFSGDTNHLDQPHICSSKAPTKSLPTTEPLECVVTENSL